MSSQEETPSAGVHGLMIVNPFILSTLTIKGAPLETEQLESKAWPQLLQASYDTP